MNHVCVCVQSVTHQGSLASLSVHPKLLNQHIFALFGALRDNTSRNNYVSAGHLSACRTGSWYSHALLLPLLLVPQCCWKEMDEGSACMADTYV